MYKNSQTFKLSDDEASRFAVRHRELPHWALGSSLDLRAPMWPGILATLGIIALLLTFHQVVLGAVEQGDLRRQVNATHVEATWRCNALQGLRASDACLTQLNSAAPGYATQQAANMPRARRSNAQYALTATSIDD